LFYYIDAEHNKDCSDRVYSQQKLRIDHKEMYLKDIVLSGFSNGPVNINCNSWVHSKKDNPQKMVFFANKVSLGLLFTYLIN
jgi:hypothetical protein